MVAIKWAYGVTTCPARRDDLLPRTLASLRDGGFQQPRLFVDGDNDPANWRRRFAGLDVTCRYPTIRTYASWVLSLWELLCREPTADRYAIFQDDFVTMRNLRQYLERCEYPAKGYWNLYTFPSNQRLAPPDRVGWYESALLESTQPTDEIQFQTGRGAVALVFSREAVLTLLSSRHMVERPLDCTRGHKAVDGAIVTALNKAGWREFVHNPSLVQHTGDVSSMGGRPHKKAVSFRGEEFDALTLL